MKRTKVILTARRDEMTGEMGLCIPGVAPSDIVNASSDGLGIAHDLIEHQNGAAEIGGIADECEALGALWFVRGCTGQLRRDSIGSAYTPEQNLASDLSRMFDDWHHGGQYLEQTTRRTRPCDDDASLEEIIRHARRNILKNENGHDISDHAAHRAAARQYLAIAHSLMRIGYRKARKKYGSTHAANNLFWDITGAVEPRTKHLDDGAQFELCYGGDRPATCFEYYPEDYYN